MTSNFQVRKLKDSALIIIRDKLVPLGVKKERLNKLWGADVAPLYFNYFKIVNLRS